ncbi:MAG: hypothetical protein AB1831_04420 [Pseudomonadota bacterium]
MHTRNTLFGILSLVACLASVQAQAASAFATNPDLYGHVLFNPPQASDDSVLEPGTGDTYGSVLFDPLAKATTDAMFERGQGDTYGSVLLDVGYGASGRSQVAAI